MKPTHFSSLLLFMIVRLGHGKTLDNRLIDNPRVNCGPDALTIEATSEEIFEGQIYIKNHRRTSSDCYTLYSAVDNSTNPTFSLPLSRISACGLEMQRDTQTKSLQLSVVVVFAFHPSFVTVGDRAFAVQCLFQQGDYPVSTKFNLIENVKSILVEGVSDIPSVQLSVIPGRLPEKLDESVPVQVSIGQPLMLVWHLTNQSMVYGIRVLDCAAQSKDGRGMQVLVNACSQDRNLVSDVRYSDEHQRAFADVTAFKFPDESELYFRCHVKLCIRKFDHLIVNGTNTDDLCPSNVNCDNQHGRSKRNMKMTAEHELDQSIIVVTGQMTVTGEHDLEEMVSSPLALKQVSGEKSKVEEYLPDSTCFNKWTLVLGSVVSLTVYFATALTVIMLIYMQTRKNFIRL